MEDKKMIPGFEGYCVTSDGTVWTRWTRGGRGHVLGDRWQIKQPDASNPKGHLRVQLYNGRGFKRFLVHRLVLTLFVGPCPDGMEGCHTDGNSKNNHISNLRWDTPVNNWADRKRHGRGGEGIKQPQAKLDDYAVKVIRRARKRGIKLKVLAARFGVSIAKVSQVALGQNWRHIDG